MAVITDMGIPGGLNQSGIPQPLYKNRWRIKMNFNRLNGAGPFSDPRAITSMAITAERPKIEYEEIEINRYNSRAYLQGKYRFQPITVVLEPDIAGRVHRVIQAQLEIQQKLIGPGPSQFLGQAESGYDYKFYTIMELLNGSHPNQGGSEVILETWHLEGCALQNVDYGDLDYQASETIKTTLTIRYDHAYQEISGQDKIIKTATGGIAGTIRR